MSSVDLDSAGRPFDNIINFRDVGKSVNKLYGSQILKEGILFRSARLDDASERDKRRLIDELHIASIIDLRSSTEHQVASKKKRTENNNSEYSVDAVDVDIRGEHLVQLSGVRRFLISLTGKAFERSLAWRLDWFNFIKVLTWLASGYRDDAVRLVIREAMQPRGLIGLSKDKLDCSGSEMKQVFDVFTSDENYPTIIHCTQGKDRTGLIVLLLLLLTGIVPQDVISADYVRSEPELVVELEERLEEIRELGLSDDYAKCPPGFIEEIKAYLYSKYGGVEGYLLSVGVSLEDQDKIRRKLLT